MRILILLVLITIISGCGQQLPPQPQEQIDDGNDYIKEEMPQQPIDINIEDTNNDYINAEGV